MSIKNEDLFAIIRIRGNLLETGKWMSKCDYVDIEIEKSEAERLVKFLTDCLKSK